MELKPIRYYRKPGYPTIEMVASNPELLRKNRDVRMIMTGFPLLLATTVNSYTPQGELIQVAPIFEHGDGEASFGGLGGAPGGYLLIDERGLEMIKSEFKTLGYTIADGITLSDVQLPWTLTWREDEELFFVPEIPGPRKGDLRLSGKIVSNSSSKNDDSMPQIFFYFLSLQDYEKWVAPGFSCTVQFYDFKKAALDLAANLAQVIDPEKMVIGIFYEPTEKDIPSCEESLRQQVRDFVEWLKSQNIL